MIDDGIRAEKAEIRALLEAEDFVDRALAHFGQKVDPMTRQRTAKRILAALPRYTPVPYGSQ